MLVICSILITVNAGIPMSVRQDVEGKILKEGDTKYLIDFSQGVKKIKSIDKSEDYSKVLVDKTKCVKE